MPAPRNGVAESMQPSLRIECWTVGRGKDDARSSDGGADRAGTRDAHADGAYLRGRNLLRVKRDQESLKSALALFDAAIQRDPRFALALTGDRKSTRLNS